MLLCGESRQTLGRTSVCECSYQLSIDSKCGPGHVQENVSDLQSIRGVSHTHIENLLRNLFVKLKLILDQNGVTASNLRGRLGHRICSGSLSVMSNKLATELSEYHRCLQYLLLQLSGWSASSHTILGH